MTDMIEPQPEGYRVVLSGPGISLDKEIPQEVALVIVQTVLSGGGRVDKLDVVARDIAYQLDQTRNPRLSLREFLDTVGPKSIAERIAVFARFLRDHNNQEDFSRDELKACFRSAGEPLPGNFPRDFATTVSTGWLAPDPSKPGRFYLTRKGDEATRSKLDALK